jgi:hypothetical protein
MLEELQVLFVVGADDAVGAQQGLVVDAQANHGEVAIGETQRGVAGGGEAEQAVGPVVNRSKRSSSWNALMGKLRLFKSTR